MTSLESLFITILAILVLITFWWVIFAFSVAVFQFLFSGWDADKIKKAWNSIRFAILGAIITMLILFMVPALAKYTKVEWYQEYSYTNIFKRATDLVSWFSRLLDIGSEVNDPSQSVGSFEL